MKQCQMKIIKLSVRVPNNDLEDSGFEASDDLRGFELRVFSFCKNVKEGDELVTALIEKAKHDGESRWRKELLSGALPSWG